MKTRISVAIRDHGVPRLRIVKMLNVITIIVHQNDASLRGHCTEEWRVRDSEIRNEKRCDLIWQQKMERWGQQWRAMEDCSTDERLQQETLCHRQWTDEYVINNWRQSECRADLVVNKTRYWSIVVPGYGWSEMYQYRLMTVCRDHTGWHVYLEYALIAVNVEL